MKHLATALAALVLALGLAAPAVAAPVAAPRPRVTAEAPAVPGAPRPAQPAPAPPADRTPGGRAELAASRRLAKREERPETSPSRLEKLEARAELQAARR